MITLKNSTKFTINKKSFSQVAKKVLFWENKGKESISFVFVNEEGIKSLNKKFRGKNKPTDVLSFNLNERNILGEVVMCPQVIKNNAKKQGVTFEYEMTKMEIHSILHLLGYDHEKSKKDEKIMEQKQNKYLSKFIK